MRNYLLIIGLIFSLNIRADEGMWMPLLLNKLNITDMQAKGFKLSAEDVYSINQASLKDAVVIFGRGCTGEIVSNEGLMLTNHHCALDYIQNHTTLQNNYLDNGFWAMNRAEELTNPGLTATILKRMEDVTEEVLKGTSQMAPDAMEEQIKTNVSRIIRNTVKDTHYRAIVRPFFGGNQYFLFVNEVFEDVRLVGAPPTSIGKFGGDTDNWVWPRHTGDFSVFRIYANSENKPAVFSPDNVPYKPAKHFEISAQGVKEGDFTMVFGYPGTTQQYVPSYHIDVLQNHQYPKLIELRGIKLDIIKHWMKQDPSVRIKYAAKDASIANAWKKWNGEITGLKKLNAIEQKQIFETGFKQWAQNQPQYTDIIDTYSKIYPDYRPLKITEQYLLELFFNNGIETARLAYNLQPLFDLWNNPETKEADIDKTALQLRSTINKHFNDYDQRVDMELTVALLNAYKKNIPAEYGLSIFQTINKKFKGNTQAYVAHMHKHTILNNQQKVDELLALSPHAAVKRMSGDPAWQLFKSIYTMYANQVMPVLSDINAQLSQLNKRYIAAKMAYMPDKVFYPDANSTLRIAYGEVKGYYARDAVYYKHFTTLDGIMEKSAQGIDDYKIPGRLKELYLNKDFGDYNVNGTVPVAFIANNHTTGGNSGSPVLNAQGQLIGINFDRAWDGVTSDLVFNKEQSRNISIDIRYVLFIIDKYANAGYLLNEMTIVK